MRKTAHPVIGVSGPAGSGKDTLANLIFSRILETFPPRYAVIRSLAKPIKSIAVEQFGFSEKQMHDPELKGIVHSYWGVTPRVMMQRLGDGLRAQFGEDVLARMLEPYVAEAARKPEVLLLIPDVRKNEEAEMVKRNNGMMVGMRGRGSLSGAEAAHNTETPVDSGWIDVWVDNSGDMEHLASQAGHVLYMAIGGMSVMRM